MLILAYSLSILSMLLLPLLLAIFLRRRFAPPWWLFCVGMAAFIGSQLFHFPLNNWLADIGLLAPTPDLQGADLWRTAALLGFTAGFSETTARIIAFWLLRWQGRARRWEDGVMVGLGHGGIEAMIFGAVLTAATLSSLWALRGVDLNTLELSPAQMAAISQQLTLFTSSPLNAFGGLVERAIAIGFHVTASLLVWQAFVRRNALYALAALVFHSLFDASAVLLVSQLGMENVWLIELVFLLLVTPGVLWAWRLSRERRQAGATPAQPLRDDVALFFTQTRKELMQQWRTRRALVTGAVFTLFGLLSPLLAYFTPQLLSSIEGAEQFAGLIPTPATVDALAQYTRNITQFGFLIAILLGMGAVAGEKERGTAAMVLSKPLPRWAFLLSKFLAQTIVYLASFALAALGAYLYTDFLFGGLMLGPFLLGNLLLLLWLLTYAAITLLGSTLAPSSGAAAALATGGAILLLLAGAVPQLAPFAPAALVAWAGQLGLEGAPPGNVGAVVSNAVLVIVCLILAVAAFEEQEL